MGQKAKIFWIPIMLTSTFLGCVIPAYIQHRVERAAATLPKPENVELLAQTIKNNSGSDCITFTYYWIYGAKVSVEEVFARYRDTLLGAGWEEVPVDMNKIAPRFREIQLGFFQKGEYHLIVDRVNAQDAVLFSGLYDQKLYLESKFEEYGPLLMLSLSLSGPCPEANPK